MIIRKLRSFKNEGKIIELSIPIRFYWNKDGTFDSVEIGPFGKPSEYENKLMDDFLNEMGEVRVGFILGEDIGVEIESEKQSEVPQVYIDAFKKDKESK